ncbi:MAG: glycine oxidase ThiO [Gemmatimonadota bacterium]
MKYDVAVVGAGIIGAAVAREVARAGATVVVVDREQPCSRTTWAAAGMLSPQAESDRPGDFLRLLLRARDAFPPLVHELEEDTGIALGYRTEGTLLVALTEEDEAELEERLAWQTSEGLDVERLDGDEVRRLEPALSPLVRWALRFPGDHQIDNRQLGNAIWFAAAAAGAEFRIGDLVRRIAMEGTTALVLDSGERVEAKRIVVAGGSWSGLLEGLPRSLPVAPVHGQLMSLTASPPLLRHVTGSPRGYLVPRSDGRLIAGTTVESTGFRTSVTPAGLHRIISIALEMVPGLAHLPVGSHWSGLRPGTPDGLPILGADPIHPELLYATGHYRNGILLGPLTGQLVGALALGNDPGYELDPFRVDRF